ncbi:MAG: hypothetical protein ACLFTZ_00145 [Acholeplasmataceae bacterium]
MKNLIRSMDDLPWLVKIILALPVLDGIVWGIYRIVKGLDRDDMLMLIVGVLWVAFGAVFLWIIDLFSIILYKRVVFIA